MMMMMMTFKAELISIKPTKSTNSIVEIEIVETNNARGIENEFFTRTKYKKNVI